MGLREHCVLMLPAGFFNLVKQNCDEKTEEMLAMSENSWNGFPRNEVPWYPTINYEQCIECGTCIAFCSHGTYEPDEKNRPVVKNPFNCVVGCCGCQSQCPAEAISFPPLSILQDFIPKK
jgi:NAD-dependent dihydropyrimidine dehydrogenase PreA subunit